MRIGGIFEMKFFALIFKSRDMTEGGKYVHKIIFGVDRQVDDIIIM